MSADNREHPGKLGNVSPDEVAEEQFQRRSDAAAERPSPDGKGAGTPEAGTDKPAAAKIDQPRTPGPAGNMPSAQDLSGHAQKN